MPARIQTFRFDETLTPSSPVSVRGRGPNGRDGGGIEAHFYPIESGIPELNFRLSLDRVGDGFFSPRHHHNFDQFRYVLSGALNIGPKLDLLPGECGYFPEGTYYGPQDQRGEGVQLIMQFPGPLASYYMTSAEARAAAEALVAGGGVFENGVYRAAGPDGRPRAKDGFEAVWEAHTGTPVMYAQPRYPAPVITKSQGYQWLPDGRRPGLEVKHLGSFTEHRTSVAVWRLASGAVLPGEALAAPEIRYVLQGEVVYEGKRLPELSCLYLPDGVAGAALASPGGAELLVISVPMYVGAVWERARSVTRAASALTHAHG
jgi:quercetin dioxygenase-like cupin family protein